MNKKNQKIIFNSILNNISDRDIQIKIRDNLLFSMGVGQKVSDVPKVINNVMGVVINPYFIAKMHSELGFPKDMSLETLREKGIDCEWNEWCEFWFKSFITIPHNILCDSKEYFRAMDW